MNKARKTLLAATLMAAIPLSGLGAETLFLTSPQNFQVMDISPNGKWACGVFVDMVMNTYGFRWNLESGEIQMLSSAEPSVAWGISDDGVVSGDFSDKSVLPNGAYLTMPGYYKNGKWNSVEVPAGKTPSDGLGYAITPDGQYVSGSLEIDGDFTPFIWKDGKIYREMGVGNDAMPYCISRDGQAAAGWAMGYNRNACYWPPEGDVIRFMDSPTHSNFFANHGQKFSPDGKTLLYWGGWHWYEESQELYLYCLYDIETGERKRIKAPYDGSEMEFYSISGSGTLVGSDGSAIVYYNNQIMSVDDYMKERGVDLSKFDGFYVGSDWSSTVLPISRAMAISDDDSVLALLYYDQEGLMRSLIVKIDQPVAREVASLEARQLEGIHTAEITWAKPVGTTIRGYNIYQDSKKLNGLFPVSDKTTSYYVANLEPGTYEFTIGVVPISGSEIKSSVTLEVKDPELAAPSNLLVRQKGKNSALLKWNEPLNDLVHLNYYDENQTSQGPFSVYEPVEMEAAICLKKAELANYEGYRLQEVSFYPMSNHSDWTLNVYNRAEDGTLTLLCSQPITQELNYRVRNTVVLDTPVEIPSDDMIVAIAVNTTGDSQSVIGAQSEIVTPGYSDLLRQVTEDNFFSAYENSMQTGYAISCMAWAIDAAFSDGSERTMLRDYTVTLDGETLATVDIPSCTAANLPDGEHTFSVKANYDGDKASRELQGSLSIAANYPAVDEVTVSTEEDSQDIIASWETPKDEDKTNIGYSTATTHYTGIKGVSTNGYSLMAACIYPADLVNPYEGYAIKSFRFYPLCDAIFTFYLFENEKLIYDKEVDSYELKEWNSVKVDEEILIKEGAEYELIIDVFDPEPATEVLAMDHMAPVDFYSNLYSITEGESWSSIDADTGYRGNWMMGMTVADPQGGALDVEGYDVLIDFKKVNAERLTEPVMNYTMPNKDTREHAIYVGTYFAGKDQPVEGKLNYFHLATAGIDLNQVAELTLRQGQNFIIAEGENVSAIAMYSLNGMKVAAAEGNSVEITNLPKDIYIVEIITPDAKVSRKIQIK